MEVNDKQVFKVKIKESFNGLHKDSFLYWNADKQTYEAYNRSEEVRENCTSVIEDFYSLSDDIIIANADKVILYDESEVQIEQEEDTSCTNEEVAFFDPYIQPVYDEINDIKDRLDKVEETLKIEDDENIDYDFDLDEFIEDKLKEFSLEVEKHIEKLESKIEDLHKQLNKKTKECDCSKQSTCSRTNDISYPYSNIFGYKYTTFKF